MRLTERAREWVEGCRGKELNVSRVDGVERPSLRNVVFEGGVWRLQDVFDRGGVGAAASGREGSACAAAARAGRLLVSLRGVSVSPWSMFMEFCLSVEEFLALGFEFAQG